MWHPLRELSIGPFGTLRLENGDYLKLAVFLATIDEEQLQNVSYMPVDSDEHRPLTDLVLMNFYLK